MKLKSIRFLTALGLSVAGWQTVILPSLHAQATHLSQDWAQSPAAYEGGRSLRDFQTSLRSGLFLLRENAQLGQPLRFSTKVTAVGRTGVRRLNIRNFQILSDGGRDVAEFNLGAGSWPSVIGVLGSAVAGDYLTQAAIRGIPIDSLEVIFTSRPGAAPSQSTGTQVSYPRNLAYTAFIISPASDAELEELRQTVERVSPVLRLVRESQKIDHGKLFYTQTPEKPAVRTLDGLREFLADKYAATQGALPFEGPDASRDPDDWRPPLRSHVKVEGDTGIRHVRTDASNFQFIHDYPRYLGGHNLGPVPEEHILGTLITCLTHIYEIVAANKQVRLDSLVLESEGTLTTHLGNFDTPPSYTGIAYRAYISSPESREVIEQLQRDVESICPIYNMLKDSQPVKGSIARGPYSEEKEKASYK